MEGPIPIGFWNHLPIEHAYHDRPDQVVSDWADAGMTLAQSPSFTLDDGLQLDRIAALLDAAHARGIKMLLRCRNAHWRVLTSQGEAAYTARVQALADRFGDHAGAWGIMVGDEPGESDFDDACRALRLVDAAAPHQTPFINLLPWFVGAEARVGFDRWDAYLDAYVSHAQPPLLSYDCYVQMNPDPQNDPAGYEVYFTNLREYQAASQRHGLPFWTTLLAVAHFRYRQPTEDDFRWQLNTALAHGARGIMWYFFYMVHGNPHVNYRLSPMDEFQTRTETYSRLARVCKVTRRWHLPVLAQLSLERVHHVGRAWGGIPLLPEGGTDVVKQVSSTFGNPLIVSEFRHADGRAYLMVVNNSQDQNERATIALRDQAVQLHQVEWEGETTIPSGSSCEAWLSPGQAELYRLG